MLILFSVYSSNGVLGSCFFVFVYILIIALVDIFDQIKYSGIGTDKCIELETILAMVCCLSKFMFYG